MSGAASKGVTYWSLKWVENNEVSGLNPNRDKKILGNVFPIIQALVDKFTGYLCWWEVADTLWN